MAGHDIIVIGGSMGSFQGVKKILADLPKDFAAAIFVVIHVGRDNGERLSDAMRNFSAAPVIKAVDGASIERGKVVFSPADHHLMLVDGHVRLGRGPRENTFRPSIDALFRSAAISEGSRVIGVVLSGYLNDGSAGAAAIKQCGGITIVQNPTDSQVPDMPMAALQSSDVDYRTDARDIAALLSDLIQAPASPRPSIPAGLLVEVSIALGQPCTSATMQKIADSSAVSCPGCGGVLSEMRSGPPLRYRCQVGHAYTAETLNAEQEASADEALRVALRIIEERVTLLNRMAADERAKGRTISASRWEQKVAEYNESADVIRRSLAAAVLA